MGTILNLIWAIAPSVMVGIILSIWNKRQKKIEETNETNEAFKIDYESLKLDLMLASAQLSYALAMAKKRGTPNGEIEIAIAQYEKAMKAFREYERKQISKKIID